MTIEADPRENNVSGFSERPQTGYVTAAQSAPRRAAIRDFDLFALIAALWARRGIFAFVLLIGLLATIAVIAARTLAGGSEIYRYPVRLTFAGAVDGKYPNDQAYALRDLIAPQHLTKVYNDIVPQGSDISPKDFVDAFSVTAYSPARSSILQKYNRLMSDRRLTFAESNELQKQMQSELTQATGTAALVRFDNSDFGLPEQTVKTALLKTVEYWSAYSIDTRGVLELNVASVAASSITMERFDGLAPVDLVRAISAVYTQIDKLISGIQTYAGARQFADPESGETLESLNRRMASLADRIVNMARGLPATSDRSTPGLEGLMTAAAFSSDELFSSDIQIGFNIIETRLDDLRENIRVIRSVSGGDTVSDQQTGLTINDLENVLSELEQYRISPLQNAALEAGTSENPQEVEFYYEQRIRELERQRAAVQAEVDSLSQVVRQYGTQQTVSGSAITQQNTVAPQLGESFIDRLVELSGQSKETEFRHELARKSIELQEKLAGIDSRLSRMRENLALFQSGRSNGGTGDPSKTAEYREKLDELRGTMRDYMEVMVRIGKRIQSSMEIRSILTSTLGISETDPRLVVGNFLSTAPLSDAETSNIVAGLREVATIANRIKATLASSVFGAEALYASIDEPKAITTELVSLQNALIFVLGMALSGFIALIVTFVSARRRDAKV